LAWVVLLAVGASAHEVAGTCAISGIRQDSVLPPIAFPFQLTGTETVPVTVDAELGTISVDFTPLPLQTFRNGFSSDSEIDTFEFVGGPVSGTIDAAGSVWLRNVRGISCTQGVCPTGPPCPCVPGNLCSNDLDRVCVVGASIPELSCEGGGVCQGVCSDDLEKSCATDDDCLPAGFCGRGKALRVITDLRTGWAEVAGLSRVGSSLDFGTGAMRMIDMYRTPIETPIVGDTGLSYFEVACSLDPVPVLVELPPGASWTLAKGKVKLGKGGEEVADDSLKLKGQVVLPGETVDGTSDLVLAFEDGGSSLLSLHVPAGSMTANKKGTKLALKDKQGTIVEINPPLPPASAAKHTVKLKRKKDGSYLMTVASKGLLLDGLDVPQLTTRVVYGAQSPSAVGAVTANAKGNKLTF